MRKFGFLINGNYRGMSYPEAFADLVSIGYTAVEIPYQTGRMAELRGEAEKAGLILSEVGMQRDYITRDPADSEKNIEETISCIKECGDAGISIINVFTGPVPWRPDPLLVGHGITPTDAWNRLISAFDRLVPAAEESGVTLAVENVWGHLCHDFFTAQYLVSRYPETAVGVNFDPSHDILSGNTDLRFLLNGWGKRCKHIHLKDAAGIMQPGKFIFPMLGEGVADWKGFMKGLDDIGYDGTLSVEFESGCLGVYFANDLSIAARESMKAIRALGLDK